MKLNEKEIKTFQNLAKSGFGKALVEYLQRLQAEICDVRNLKNEDIASARLAAEAIQKEIIDRINLVNLPKDVKPSDYE